MILLYKVGLTSTPKESTLSFVDELMGVEACFLESNPNFLTIFLAYFSCEMNMSSFFLFNLKTKEKRKLPYHTHLKFFLHLLRELYSSSINGSSKYYVINIYLSHEKVIPIILDK